MLSKQGVDEDAVARIIKEVHCQLAMDHPNICRLLEVIEEEKRIILVLERLRGPDLFEHFDRKGRYSEDDAAVFIRQMCSAVHYCHKQGVCHRDLKLENFCLESDSDEARLKMIDFGLSETFLGASATAVPMIGAVGTLIYVAPEVLNGAYSEKC